MRKCPYCKSPLPQDAPKLKKFCNSVCQSKFWREKYYEKNPLTGVNAATTGAISELRVAVDLLAKGYHVFRALSPSCPCDLAILANGKLLKIEVRTTHISTAGKIYRTRGKGEKDKDIDHWAFVLPDKILYEPPLLSIKP